MPGPVISPWQADEDQPVTSPGQVGEQPGPVVSPWQADNQVEATGQHPSSSPTSETQKVGVSHSGFNPQTYQKVRGAMGGSVGEATNLLSGYEEKQQQSAGAYAVANRKRKTGLNDEMAATSEMHAEESKLLERHRDFLETQQHLEQRLYDDSKVERQKYLTAATEQLAAARQLAMQSGNPLAMLGIGGQSAMGGAQFAEGFLAARGVHINVTAQIDKMVDRGIQEHQQRIANVRQNAADQFHLYDIARQSSVDDFEARQRYRAFVIDGFKMSVQASAARFNSQIAMAQGQQKTAELDIMLNQHLEQMADQYQTKWMDGYKAILTNKVEQGKLAIDRDRLAFEKKKLEAKEKPKGNWTKLTDPFDVKRDGKGKALTGGKVKWEIDTTAPDGIQTQAAKEHNTAKQFYTDFAGGLERLDELRQKAQGMMKGPDRVRAMRSQEYREYQQQRDYLTEIMQKHVTGAAAPDAQAARIMNWLKDDNLTESGSNKEFIPNLRENLRKSWENTMNNTVGIVKRDPNSEEEYDYAVTGDPDSKDVFEARAHGGKGEDLPAGKAAKAYSDAVNADAKSYLGKSNAVYEEYQNSGGVTDRRRDHEDGAVERLFSMVVKPDTFEDDRRVKAADGKSWERTEGYESPEEIQQEAHAALTRLAENGNGYAKYLLSRVQEGARVLEGLRSEVDEPAATRDEDRSERADRHSRFQ